MPDNGTAASGPTIAWDEIGGVAYQRIKLAIGADGVYTGDVDGSVARGLYVDPRQKVSRIQATSAGLTTASTAYVAGDQLGTILTVSGAVRASGATGTILSATLLDKAAIIGAVDVYLFDRSVTLAADNAVAAFSDTDMVFCLGILQFPPPKTGTGNGLATIEASGLAFACNASDLFVALVTRAGHTFFGAIGDLVLSLVIAQD